MLQQMSWKTFLEWQVFFQLEPPDQVRNDFRFAQLVATLINVNRGKRSRPIRLDDVLLRFGDEKKPPKPQQTWQQQKAIAKMFYNLFGQGTDKRRRSRRPT